MTNRQPGQPGRPIHKTGRVLSFVLSCATVSGRNVQSAAAQIVGPTIWPSSWGTRGRPSRSGDSLLAATCGNSAASVAGMHGHDKQLIHWSCACRQMSPLESPSSPHGWHGVAAKHLVPATVALLNGPRHFSKRTPYHRDPGTWDPKAGRATRAQDKTVQDRTSQARPSQAKPTKPSASYAHQTHVGDLC